MKRKPKRTKKEACHWCKDNPHGIHVFLGPDSHWERCPVCSHPVTFKVFTRGGFVHFNISQGEVCQEFTLDNVGTPGFIAKMLRKALKRLQNTHKKEQP